MDKNLIKELIKNNLFKEAYNIMKENDWDDDEDYIDNDDLDFSDEEEDMLYQGLETIEDVLDHEGIEYVEDPDYSGRGMYGKTTPAYTVDKYDYRAAINALDRAGVYYRSDSMGLDMVIY